MAKVPYSPASTEKPIQSGTPRLAIDAPGAAFGENVGQAIIGLGRQLDRSGDELFARAVDMQKMKEDADAREKDAEFIVSSGELYNSYKDKLGKDAVEGSTQFRQDIVDLRAKIREGLKSDYARRQFDAQTQTTMARTIFSAGSHAATENKRYNVQASEAEVKAIHTEVLTRPEDDDTYNEGMTRIAQAAVRKQNLLGWSPEQTKQYAIEQTSELSLKRIEGLVREQPFKAQEMLKNYLERGLIRGEAVTKATNLVRQQMVAVGSRNIAAEVRNDPEFTDAPLQTQVDEALRRAREISPNNTMLETYVEQRVIALHNFTQTSKRNQDFLNRQTVESGLMGGPDGKIPTTVEELTADPKAREAWNNLDPQVQRRYLGVLGKNAKGDVTMTDDRLREYQRLRGLAQEDPVAFLAEDMVSKDLPLATRRAFIDAQNKMKQSAGKDPRVTRIINQLRPVLNEAGISRERNKDRWDQFIGAAQDAAEAWQAENKKEMPPEEIRKLGSRLLREQTPSSWNPLNPGFWQFGAQRQFEARPDAKLQESIRDELRNRGYTGTDEEVNQVYRREIFRKLYGSQPKAKPPEQPRAPQSK